MTIESFDQVVKLLFADVRRRAAAEVSKPQLPALKGAGAAVNLILLDQRVEIDLDLGGVLVGVDFEVTELAALAAKRNVEVKPERLVVRAGAHRARQSPPVRIPVSTARTADSSRQNNCRLRFLY